MKRSSLLGFISLSLLYIAPVTASAKTITPSHVYQKTEELRLTLINYGFLDEAVYKENKREKSASDNALRHPRHVMQQVRECDMIFTELLKSHNVETRPLPEPGSIREVRPADVMDGVKTLIRKLASTQKERTYFSAPLQEGKVPDDVYRNLRNICHAIKIDLSPSDVFRVVAAINNNLDKAAKARGYRLTIETEPAENKTYAQIYKESREFLLDLRRLALNPDFAIPGGVIVPEDSKADKVNLWDVMGVMNDALSETYAINYALNLRERTPLPEHEEQKTNADIYAMIERAHSLIRELLKEEAMDEG